MFSISGNPADAVKLALRTLLPEKPTLVVSGINRGENTGIDIIYSGTVAGAREAAIAGIPAIAFSRSSKNYPDFLTAGHFAREITTQILKQSLPVGVVLNVNVPGLDLKQINGVRITSQAVCNYHEEVQIKWKDNDMGVSAWADYHKVVEPSEQLTDHAAVRQGYVSITPLHHRLTDHGYFDELKHFEGML